MPNTLGGRGLGGAGIDTLGTRLKGGTMTVTDDEHLGLIRYVGKSVEAGYLDAGKSAQALLGVDEVLRYFVGAQDSSFAKADFEVPVRVRQGSVEIVVPDTAVLLASVLGPPAAVYLSTAAKKMAERDFDGVGLRDLFSTSLQALQWAIRIAKHVGTLTRRVFDSGVQWRHANREIGIPNAAGELLFVPVEYLDLYERMPANLLVKITSVVEVERTLEVVVRRDGRDESVAVSVTDKPIFCPDADDVLFPELEHGAPFEHEGMVTRGNENANSLGFQYKGHILTCYPEEGNIARFKPALFLKSRLVGTVSRADKFGAPVELRPKVVFTSVEPVEDESVAAARQQPLFFDSVE